MPISSTQYNLSDLEKECIENQVIPPAQLEVLLDAIMCRAGNIRQMAIIANRRYLAHEYFSRSTEVIKNQEQLNKDCDLILSAYNIMYSKLFGTVAENDPIG